MQHSLLLCSFASRVQVKRLVQIYLVCLAYTLSMSSLFSDLPALAGGKQDVGAEEPSQAANKRRKLDPTDQIDRQKPSGSSLFSDPVVAALVKITTHISSSKKFNKASELLRQLIVGDKIGPEHSKLVFEVHRCC